MEKLNQTSDWDSRMREEKTRLIDHLLEKWPEKEEKSKKCSHCGGNGDTMKCKGGIDWDRIDGFNSALSATRKLLEDYKKEL